MNLSESECKVSSAVWNNWNKLTRMKLSSLLFSVENMIKLKLTPCVLYLCVRNCFSIRTGRLVTYHDRCQKHYVIDILDLFTKTKMEWKNKLKTKSNNHDQVMSRALKQQLNWYNKQRTLWREIENSHSYQLTAKCCISITNFNSKNKTQRTQTGNCGLKSW